MNYIKLHDKLIEQAKIEERVKHQGIYYEKHHIIPQCLNGTNNEENLVLLTAREHFIVHWLLTKIYKDDFRLMYAFNQCGQRNKGIYRPTSRLYKYAREKYIHALKHNDVWKKKMGKSMEKLVWIKNIETKDCLRIHPNSFDDFQKMGYAIGRIIENRKPHTKETKQKIAAAHKGQHLSKKHKEVLRVANSNKMWINDGKKNIHTKIDHAESLLKNGWIKGRLKNQNSFGKSKGKCWVHNQNKRTLIIRSDINKYLQQGWKLGSNCKTH